MKTGKGGGGIAEMKMWNDRAGRAYKGIHICGSRHGTPVENTSLNPDQPFGFWPSLNSRTITSNKYQIP